MILWTLLVFSGTFKWCVHMKWNLTDSTLECSILDLLLFPTAPHAPDTEYWECCTEYVLLYWEDNFYTKLTLTGKNYSYLHHTVQKNMNFFKMSVVKIIGGIPISEAGFLNPISSHCDLGLNLNIGYRIGWPDIRLIQKRFKIFFPIISISSSSVVLQSDRMG